MTLISKFKDYIHRIAMKKAGNIFGVDLSFPAKPEKFYLIDLYKHIDEKISDEYNRVSCEFVDDDTMLTRKFKIYLEKDGEICKTITLVLRNMFCLRINISPESEDNKIIRDIFYFFLTDNDAMEEEEEIEEEEDEEIEDEDIDDYEEEEDEDIDDYEWEDEDMDESISEKYKALYVTPLELDKTYCQFIGLYPPEIRKAIVQVCSFINNKYKNILVTKMTRRIQPGLIIKNGNIQHIATDIYHMFNAKGIDVRIVYGEGYMDSITGDIHNSDGELVVKIGRTTDALKGKKGIFKEHSLIR